MPSASTSKPASSHLLALTFILLLPAFAAANCATPSAAGVQICQPSANSTIYQVPHIEASANPTSGSISNMKVYIDGKLNFQNNGALNVFLGGVSNGRHRLTVVATDDFGRTYNQTEYFSVTGNLPSSCKPSEVGVRICWPSQGQVVGQNLAMALGFKGQAAIHHVRAYVGSTPIFDFTPDPGQEDVIGSGAGTTAGQHTLTVVVWDTNGRSYKNAVQFKAFYVGTCPPRGDACTPGIYPTTPQDGDDVESPFRVDAEVQNNTATITAMKAYLDSAVVAQASGPILDQKISASRGTHILVIQAWDSKGQLYRITENVNVQ